MYLVDDMNQCNTGEQEQYLNECIEELNGLNMKLATMLVRKEELTNSIIASLGHEHEGQKSYSYGKWKIEVKTPCVYSINKEVLKDDEFYLPDDFNPIRESVSYTVDKKLCDKYVNEAPEEIREILVNLIDKKPGKPSVNLKYKA